MILRLSRALAPKDEGGNSAFSFILAFPIVFVLLLGIVEVGWAFRTRATVLAVVRDTTRLAAQNGGDCNPLTNSNTGVPDASGSTVHDCTFNNGTTTAAHQKWSTTGTNLLHTNDRWYRSGVTFAVDCNPDVAVHVGDDIQCYVDYPYKGLNYQPLRLLGIDKMVGLGNGKWHIVYTARAETGSSN